MILSESFKNRLKNLAGIVNEIKLIPDDTSGRSNPNTLSWFTEEYLLNLSSIIITSLDNSLKNNGINLAISQGNTKIQQNTVVTKLIVNNTINLLFTALVAFNSGANTVITISIPGGNTQQFNLNAQHTESAVNDLVQEIITYVQNIL